MNPYLAMTLAIFGWIGQALRTAAIWLLYPFKPIWYFVYILLLPFIHLGHVIWTVVTYPARVFPGSVVEVSAASDIQRVFRI